jgi:aminodeoxyfutalosine synthase
MIGDILERALSGERLSVDDGVRLFESDDIHAIGSAANQIRRRLHGDKTYYIVNCHINYTDICVNQCKFCAYSRREDDPRGYVMSAEEAVAKAAEHNERLKFSEIHIVGGCHPKLRLEYYTNLLSSLRSAFPDAHLQAFTAVEIAHIANVEGADVPSVLKELKAAGLGSIPGGGAEIFDPGVRAATCPEKLPGDRWLDVMRQAHELGIRSNATMLYGHVETHRQRIEHMARIREVQDRTGGFLTFIPLKFHPCNTQLPCGHQSAVDDLKTYAISRLMLDNVAHVKAFWIMLGVKLSQVALSFGADDFDGTVVEEKITHRAGATTPLALSIPEIRALIEETGTVAVERNTLYEPVVRDSEIPDQVTWDEVTR